MHQNLIQTYAVARVNVSAGTKTSQGIITSAPNWCGMHDDPLRAARLILPTGPAGYRTGCILLCCCCSLRSMQLFVGKRRLSSYAPLAVDVLTIFAAAQRTPFAVAMDQDTQKVQSQLVDEDSWPLWTGDD